MRYLLLVCMFFIGCATGVTGLLRFQDRELLVHPDLPALSYPHVVTSCTPRRFLPDRCTSTHKIDIYDLNDESVRRRLIDAGFTCKSVARFKY
jgi:hypothetical protein